MQVTIQLSPQLLSAVRENSALREIEQLVAQLGGKLDPMHPGTTDPELRAFFVADLTDGPDLEASLHRLRTHPGVEAAYLKPADEAP